MNLYEEYGKAMIQAEIWGTKVQKLKELIVNELNKPNAEPKPEEKKEEKK